MILLFWDKFHFGHGVCFEVAVSLEKCVCGSLTPWTTDGSLICK